MLLDGVKRFDIAVRLDDTTRDSVESLRRIPLRTATGAIVPLSRLVPGQWATVLQLPSVPLNVADNVEAMPAGELIEHGAPRGLD